MGENEKSSSGSLNSIIFVGVMKLHNLIALVGR